MFGRRTLGEINAFSVGILYQQRSKFYSKLLIVYYLDIVSHLISSNFFLQQNGFHKPFCESPIKVYLNIVLCRGHWDLITVLHQSHMADPRAQTGDQDD